MAVRSPCAVCDQIHVAREVGVVGSRFAPGPKAFHAEPDGPSRSSRREAQLDVCPGWVT